MNSKNTTDLNILDLARKLQCHSHGYMCQDCPQPDEPEIVRLLEQLISNREREAYSQAVNDITEPYMSKRAMHMLTAIRSGKFTTYYRYAKDVGISHQAAGLTYKKLVDAGLVDPLQAQKDQSNIKESE